MPALPGLPMRSCCGKLSGNPFARHSVTGITQRRTIRSGKFYCTENLLLYRESMNEEKTVPVSIMKKTWNPEYNSVMKKIKALTVCFILLLFFNCLSAQNPGKLWARAAGGCNSVMGQSLSADPSGNIFVTGVFGYPSITFGNTTFYNSDSGVDLFLAKYDSRGNLLWASTAG